jgi:hypothetical protein
MTAKARASAALNTLLYGTGQSDDVDVYVARYVNDGTGGPAGRSGGPRGGGSWDGDASIEAPFHYRVVSVPGDDGAARMRFPTRREQPGGGRGYFAFNAYAVLRKRFLGEPVGCAWTVDVPARSELSERGWYHENRFVFSAGIENVRNSVGVRFIDEGRLGVFLDASDTPEAVLDLGIDCRGTRLHLAVALGSTLHPGRFVLHANEGGVVVNVDPVQLTAANVDALVMSSAGNGLAQPGAGGPWETNDDDDDEALFFWISDIAAVTR